MACGGGDAHHFDDALQALAEDPHRSLRLCRRLEQQDLRDHCLVAVVESGALAHQAAYLCLEITTELWRDECWFVAAEGAVQAAQHPQALERCRRAGRFSKRCVSHIWHLAAAAGFEGASSDQQWAQATYRAALLHLELSLQDEATLRSHWYRDLGWQNAMRMAMQRRRRADPALCEALGQASTQPDLSPLRTHTCLGLLNKALESQLRKVWPRRDEALEQALCKRPDEQHWPGPTGSDMGWSDDSRLYPGLQTAAARLCPGSQQPQAPVCGLGIIRSTP